MGAVWPNFFIVGAAKCGTSSLHAWLRQHPQVFMPMLKEPHFFAQVYPSPEQQDLEVIITDETAYLELFAPGRDYPAIGEASPSYLWSDIAPQTIRARSPNARIIILLCDPVARAYSHYLMDYREGVQNLPFYNALQKDYRRSEKGWLVSQLYVELGCYAAHVRRYLETFGADRVLVLLLDDLRQDPQETLRRVAVFLGIDVAAMDKIDTSHVENGFAVARSEWARRLMGSRWVRRFGRAMVPEPLQLRIYRGLMLKPAAKPPMDPRAREMLIDIYDGEVRDLERLLGRPLPELRRSWSP